MKTRILIKVADQKAPPLTQSETAKISEHILKIQSFLNKKSKKYDFGLAPSIINSAADIISNRPSRAASLLGSYFFKPEDFTSYLYACRLMIECLEVAVSKQRNGYIESVMSVGDRDIAIALN